MLNESTGNSYKIIDRDYENRIKAEIEVYRKVDNVHDLPIIFNYWSNKYLLPKMKSLRFDGINDFYSSYIFSACKNNPERINFIISIGAGNCEYEVELVELAIKQGITNFEFHCLDLNPHMLERGQELASKKGAIRWMKFIESDIKSWTIDNEYSICIANHFLHHVLDLEVLFEKIKTAIHPNGVFLTNDMIGRNGHMRWPEALEVISHIWSQMPDRYKYNHLLKRFEKEYKNWDCSKDGFEGIRAQDVLPLLIQNFEFDFFFAFNNIITIFIDRCFGHNFDANNPEDLNFIDYVAQLDEDKLENGSIKPTQIIAAMRTLPVSSPKFYKHFTPEFCLRNKELQDRTAWVVSIEQELSDLEKELKERTEWALSLEKELKERTEWALSLEKELKERTEWALSLEKELKERTEWALSLEKELKGVYNSKSWLITYPLRYATCYLKKIYPKLELYLL